MKSYAVLWVAFAMLVKPLWPVVEYVVNYDYIVNVLCDNKDKPQLNCEGKCYLAKQLAKEQRQNGDHPFGKKSYKTKVNHFICQAIKAFTTPYRFDGQRQEHNFASPQRLFSPPILDGISHPPELG